MAARPSHHRTRRQTLPTSPITDHRRVYGLDDRLDYAEAAAAFTELTKRYLRYQYESGKIDAYRGAGGKLYFRYGDLLHLRDSLRVSHAPKGRR